MELRRTLVSTQTPLIFQTFETVAPQFAIADESAIDQGIKSRLNMINGLLLGFRVNTIEQLGTDLIHMSPN